MRYPDDARTLAVAGLGTSFSRFRCPVFTEESGNVFFLEQIAFPSLRFYHQHRLFFDAQGAKRHDSAYCEDYLVYL